MKTHKNFKDDLVFGYDLLHQFMDESDDLRKDIEVLTNKLIDRNEGVLKQVHPDLIEDYKKLKGVIKEQKDENESLYKQLLALKKDTASATQKIALCQSRIQRLEGHIGHHTEAAEEREEEE